MIDKGNMLGLNDFWNLTKSQKLSRTSYILDMLVEKIDNNQCIKRLMRYLTENPLAKRSFDLEGNTIIQKDLVNSLTEKSALVYSDGRQIDLNECLYDEIFNPNMEVLSQTYIFVENQNNVYRDNIGYLYFNIHIVIPKKYNKITNNVDGMKFKRNNAIAMLIDDMLDGYTVDDKYSEYVGNIKFELTGTNEERLNSNNDYIRTTLTYRTIASEMRYLNDKYI